MQTDTTTIILRARHILIPHGIVSGSVHIANGSIVDVRGYDDVPAGAPCEDLPDDLVLMPGLVDTHVHINDPGRTHWEGFLTATRAAAAGGVTTLVDMPLNSIPATTDVASLWRKVEASEGKLWVDFAVCGGVVPGNAGQLRSMVQAGAVAFKCFLTESGVDEFRNVTEDDLKQAMPVLADMGTSLLVHAELSGPIDAVARTQHNLTEQERSRYVNYLLSRPRAAENQAVDLMVRLAREFRTRTHIVHLSSSDALLALRDAQDQNLPIDAETCPHYLTLSAEMVPDGATAFKCAPPIREEENRDRLWSALKHEWIRQVVTDHSPATPTLKCMDTGDFLKAWGGISSLQIGLPVVWTESSARGFSLSHVAQWMCEQTSQLVGLHARKGRIAVGCDADLVAFDPEALFRVEPSQLQHRHPVTPYAQRTLRGRVHSTWVRGQKVFHQGSFSPAPCGRWLSSSH